MLPDGFLKAHQADSHVFTEFSELLPNAYVFGSLPAVDYAITVLSVVTPSNASLSYPILVAGKAIYKIRKAESLFDHM